MPALKLSAWLSVMIAAEIFLVMICTGKVSFQMDAAGWGLSVLMSALVATTALLAFQYGAPKCGAQTAALLSTIEPLSSVLIGVIFLHESMNIRIFLGICLIMFSIIVQIKRGGQQNGRT